MLVFFVISTQLGGAERSLIDFLQGLKKSSTPFLVVIPKSTGPLVQELQNLNASYEILEIPDWVLKLSRKNGFYTLLTGPAAIVFGFRYLIKIHKLLKRHSVQAIHSTGIKFHLLLGFYSFFNSKIPITLHMRDIVHNKFLHKLYQSFAQIGRVQYVANSQATALSLAPTASKLIYNGFDAQVFRKSPSELKTQLKISADSKLVAVVGVIARWKGQREFLEMANRICNTRNDIHFLIVGDEIYDTRGEQGEMDYLKARVQELGLTQRVHFLGFQKNLVPIYSGVDVLVHSSIQPEPFGRVIVEAMLCSCPVTASGMGGPLEIIVHEKNGLLHQPQQTEAMAKNVIRLIDDAPFAHSLTQQALLDSNKFSMETYVDDLKNHLVGQAH